MAVPKSQTTMGVNEGGFSSWLWTKFEKHAAFALYDPFVVALAAGTLEMKCFENYIAQDVYYLDKYVEACKLAEVCEDNKDDKKEFSILTVGVEAESYAQNLRTLQGRLNEEACSPNTVTLKYSELLLATAAGQVEGGNGVNPVEKTKIPAYTIATMTPCSRLYSFLGQQIAKALESDHDHPYEQWIKLLFPGDNKGSSLSIEKLLDKLAKSLTREELQVLESLYYQALKLDIEFLSAQPFDQRTLVPLLKMGHSVNHRYTIVSDFDLSCTVLDSSAVLAEIAILSTLNAEQNGSENPGDGKSSSDIWDELSSQYSREYDEWLRKILPSEKANTFDYEGLYKFLEKLSQIELEASSKVVGSRVLRDLNINDIEKARELRLILKKINHPNVNMHIISVRWSGDIIRAAFLTSGLDGVHIHSNKLAFVESFSMDGFDSHVDTSINKFEIFNNILNSTKEYDMEHTSIYIGRDDLGDLLCLLKADIGIVIGTCPNIKRVGEHFGVSFIPFFLGLVNQEKTYAKDYNGWIPQCGTIYTVSSWSEIHAFLLGS